MSRCPACGRRHKRSNPQNRMYWELLTLMSEREWSGERYTGKAFHLYFRQKYLGCDDVKLPNGKVEAVPLSTADLDPAEFSDYYTKVEADCAERGVFLPELPT